MWLGLAGRVKIGALEARCAALEAALDKMHADFRALDLEMTSQVDRLAGLAKRYSGRLGGRPPNKPDEKTVEGGDEATLQAFSRHVL